MHLLLEIVIFQAAMLVFREGGRNPVNNSGFSPHLTTILAAPESGVIYPKGLKV